MANAVWDFTFFWGSYKPCFIVSTSCLRWGNIEQPIKIAICWIILIPVCRAYQLFLLVHTAFKNGKSDPTPNALATTAKALDVAFLTNSYLWSISGLITVIIVGSPAAFAKLLIIYLPSTLA